MYATVSEIPCARNLDISERTYFMSRIFPDLLAGRLLRFRTLSAISVALSTLILNPSDSEDAGIGFSCSIGSDIIESEHEYATDRSGIDRSKINFFICDKFKGDVLI